MVELAETLVDRIDFAEWAVFAKNGSDLTTWAIRVARESTGDPLVIKAKGAYHGVDSWCDPVMEDESPMIVPPLSSSSGMIWNHFRSSCPKTKGKVAALVLTPYHHAAFAPSELPASGFWAGVEELCRRNGVLLILDDVRCGGRLHGGGSHRYFGFTPDLAVYSKALGNGYAISLALERRLFAKHPWRFF